MATQLLQVMLCGSIGGQTLAALLQIDQRHFNLRRFTFTGDAHENVFDVDAAVLPAALVHARQVLGEVLEDFLVDHVATLIATTGSGQPVFQFLEAIERFGDEQRAPLVLRIRLGATKDDLRHAHTQFAYASQGIEFAQYGRATKGCNQLR